MNDIQHQDAMLILKEEIEEGSITERQFDDIIEITEKQFNRNPNTKNP